MGTPVGGPNDQKSVCFAGSSTILQCMTNQGNTKTVYMTLIFYQLDKELCFDSPGGFMFCVTALSQQRVNLVHEDDSWLEAACNCK